MPAAGGTGVHLTLRSRSEPLKGPAGSGRLAQLVERFVYTEDVGGSSPSSPTIQTPDLYVIFAKGQNL